MLGALVRREIDTLHHIEHVAPRLKCFPLDELMSGHAQKKMAAMTYPTEVVKVSMRAETSYLFAEQICEVRCVARR